MEEQPRYPRHSPEDQGDISELALSGTSGEVVIAGKVRLQMLTSDC